MALDLVHSDIPNSFNSIGPKFSSQGYFHSLQLLNVPQFLFSRVFLLKTAPRGNFNHAYRYVTLSTDAAMLFAPFGCTHPPPPVLPFLLMQNLSLKDIAGSDIIKLKVS